MIQELEPIIEAQKSQIDPALLQQAVQDAKLIAKGKEFFERHNRRGPKSDPPTRGRHSIHPDSDTASD
jgi:hypothetical protein